MNRRLAQILALSSGALILLTALILVGYFTLQDYRAIRQQLSERSDDLATAFAQLVSFPLFTGDRELLQRHLRRILDHPLVIGVEVRDPDGRLLAREGSPRPGDGLSVTRPVRTEALDAGEEAIGLDAPLPPARLGSIRLGISLADSQARKNALLRQSALILLLCLLIGGGLAWWLGRRLARPIRELSEAAEALSRGELERRVTPAGPLEVVSLGREFNAMAEALAHAHEEMQREVERATAALQRSLRRLEEKNRELEAARRQAQAASDAKGRFLANMSHEIRTPMNAIVGFTRLLYKASADPAQRHHLLTIQHSAESLLTLIDDILELAQMEKGQVHLRAVDFQLREILDDVCALLAPLAHEKQLELALLINPGVPDALIGDPCRLKQILNNLIGNAIKYTPAGEVTIRVTVKESGERDVMLEFSIRDSGIGIDKRQRRRIFQAFSQGDEAVTRHYEGSGLGLTIARSLVVRMGGEIDFESQPGHGTTFWFTAWMQRREEARPSRPLSGHEAVLVESHPLSRLALTQDLERLGAVVHPFERLRQAQGDTRWESASLRLIALGSPRRFDQHALREVARLNRDPRNLILANSASLADYQILAQHGIPAPVNKPVPRRLLEERVEQLLHPSSGGPGAEDEAPLAPGRILVCEDNAVNRALYLALFQELGLEAEILDSAEQTLERLEHGGADLVIMDVHMPGMSGLEAIRRIRALPGAAAAIPIVCVSADVFSQSDCLAAGADAFLAKPIDEQALESLLEQHLGRQRRRRETALSQRMRQRLLPLFLEALPQHRERIERSWSAGDIAALRAELHKLDGACAYCHLPRLCRTVRALSRCLKRGGPEAGALMAELRRAMEELLSPLPTDSLTDHSRKNAGDPPAG